MKLLRVRLRHFRGIDERELVFAREGVTLVTGPNEIGKSSFAEALDLLFEDLSVRPHITGTPFVAYRGVNRVTEDLRTSLWVAFIIIGAVILLLFRSPRIAVGLRDGGRRGGCRWLDFGCTRIAAVRGFKLGDLLPAARDGVAEDE